MVCTTCKAEFNDDSRFCPRCGAAKPDKFHSGEVPFFVQTEEGQSAEGQSAEAERSVSNSGPPYESPEFRHRMGEQSQGYTPYRPPSLSTDGTSSARERTKREHARNPENPQGAQHTSPLHGPPYQPPSTFDDDSVRRFLIGFTVVAATVIVLVVALVLISGS